MSAPPRNVLSDLAPTGKLRVGINLSNSLLTTTDRATGNHGGVAVEIGRELARRLGVPVEIAAYPSPGALADSAMSGEWDVGFLGAEAQRANQIDFTAPYVEIEATYLVPPGSPLHTVADVDQAGVRIAAMAKSAYGLYLARTLKHATLIEGESLERTLQRYVDEGVDALAGLRPGLLANRARQPGSRILEDGFHSVKQAAGVPKGRGVGVRYLRTYIEDVKRSGFVGGALERNGVTGLTLAPAASLDAG